MAISISDDVITNIEEEQRLYLVHTNRSLSITVLAAHERKPWVREWAKLRQSLKTEFSSSEKLQHKGSIYKTTSVGCKLKSQ